jgi:hypothetical protein
MRTSTDSTDCRLIGMPNHVVVEVESVAQKYHGEYRWCSCHLESRHSQCIQQRFDPYRYAVSGILKLGIGAIT